MDQLILSVLAIRLQVAQISLEQMASAPVAEAAVLSSSDYKAYAVRAAARQQIDPVPFTRTLECESKWNPDARGKLGELGIAQIYRKYHPDVSPAQALDGIWSIDWAAARFAEGKAGLWSCYKTLYGV